MKKTEKMLAIINEKMEMINHEEKMAHNARVNGDASLEEEIINLLHLDYFVIDELIRTYNAVFNQDIDRYPTEDKEDGLWLKWSLK